MQLTGTMLAELARDVLQHLGLEKLTAVKQAPPQSAHCLFVSGCHASRLYALLKLLLACRGVFLDAVLAQTDGPLESTAADMAARPVYSQNESSAQLGFK